MIIAFCCCLRLVIVDHRFYSRPPASFPWEALPTATAWNYSCGLLDLWGCHSWKFITAKKTTHVLVEPKSPPTKTLRYEKYCSLSRAHFLAQWHEDDEDEVARCTLQYAQATADTKSRNDEETTTTLLNAYDSLSNCRGRRHKKVQHFCLS